MTKPSLRHLVKQEFGRVSHFCIYAVLEWALIFLLSINGFLAFVATQFAKCCELRNPCLLCSRIDHVFAERDEDFYYNETMCELHRRDVSYLAYCHNHKKLSDIRKMCEACLLSFATEKESDGDTYKSLVGILHKDLECFVEDDDQIHLSLGKNTEEVFQIERSRCSCCGLHSKLKNAIKGKNINLLAAAAPSSAKLDGAELRLRLESDALEDEKPQIVIEDSKTSMSLVADGEGTPTFMRGNKFFGISLPDSNKTFSRRTTLDKVEFGSESIEASVASEPDESILHRLKRQVRLDRKSLMALYMELDEERNASAVAANNAMAMITRLQADKAAVQMEALQYQRMMEEQAEYDQEALQETQKIIRDLETELEAYRHKFGYLEGFGIAKEVVVPAEEEEDYQGGSSQAITLYCESSAPPDQFIETKDNDIVISDSLGGSQFIETKDSDGVISNSLGGLQFIETKDSDDVISNSLGGSQFIETKNSDVVNSNSIGGSQFIETKDSDDIISDSLGGSQFIETKDSDNVISDSFGGLQVVETKDSDIVISDNLGGLQFIETKDNDIVISDSLDGSVSSKDENDQVGTVLDNSIRDFDEERSEILNQIKTLEDRIQVAADDADQTLQSSSDVGNNNKNNTEEETSEDIDSSSVKTPDAKDKLIKADITKELSFLSERVLNLEAHSDFLKDAAKTLQKGGDGTELLKEISENLQKLRHLMSISVDQPTAESYTHG